MLLDQLEQVLDGEWDTAAGKTRFRAIFLTSLTTVAGLAPLIFEKSRQAQFLIPFWLHLKT